MDSSITINRDPAGAIEYLISELLKENEDFYGVHIYENVDVGSENTGEEEFPNTSLGEREKRLPAIVVVCESSDEDPDAYPSQTMISRVSIQIEHDAEIDLQSTHYTVRSRVWDVVNDSTTPDALSSRWHHVYQIRDRSIATETRDGTRWVSTVGITVIHVALKAPNLTNYDRGVR